MTMISRIKYVFFTIICVFSLLMLRNYYNGAGKTTSTDLQKSRFNINQGIHAHFLVEVTTEAAVAITKTGEAGLPSQKPSLPVTDDVDKNQASPQNTTEGSGRGNLPVCPDTPNGLVGALSGIHKTVSQETLEYNFFFKPDVAFSPVTLGGEYIPNDCRPKQRVAIVIPYRKRFEHLHILLNNLIPILRRQKIHFRVFVIEQDNPSTFNRGMLQNVGFLEVLRLDNSFDCFIFHDVDMLLINDKAFYRCNVDNPLHLTGGISKFHYKLPYDKYSGGILAFTKQQYEQVNGNSNLYFGWGGEDDDIYIRIRAKNLKMLRYPANIGKFDMIKHQKDKGNEVNPDRMNLLGKAKSRQDVEGLMTTSYSTTGVRLLPLYTWIHVHINMKGVLETAPPDCQKFIKSLIRKADKFETDYKGKTELPYQRSKE